MRRPEVFQLPAQSEASPPTVHQMVPTRPLTNQGATLKRIRTAGTSMVSLVPSEHRAARSYAEIAGIDAIASMRVGAYAKTVAEVGANRNECEGGTLYI